ncbi:MAG: hypothetical protein Q9219_005003 [cf. Caloplaca sp. 3 TL-2023]
MDFSVHSQGVIDISDDSDDGQHVHLEDFMTAEELDSVLQGPLASPPKLENREISDAAESRMGNTASLPSFEECLPTMLERFPDISQAYVRKLYDERRRLGVPPDDSLPNALIWDITDRGDYPKQRDHLNDLKRKSSSDLQGDGRRIATHWKTAPQIAGDWLYPSRVPRLLQDDFPEIPRKYIDLKFKEHRHLYGTYLALGLAEDTYEDSQPKPYTKLKKTRRPSTTDFYTRDPIDLILNSVPKLKEELEAARAQRKTLQIQRQTEKDAADAQAAEEKRLRDNRQVMECACCFTDDVPLNKITFCSADIPHPFCFDCAATNANTQIGLSRYALVCMDGSGCKEPFSRHERRRFLDVATIGKLERLQQQTELREADLIGLENCPFCDFAAVCPPVEVDKEFRCTNSECEKVSCRRCRQVTHIPLSCAEFKKSEGVSERHEIEEARTKALLRTCPRCKSAIVKEGGCNKIVCSCGGVVCDVCGADISENKYRHFVDKPAAGKCHIHDLGFNRHQASIERAEKETMEKIRAANPELSEDDLQIKFRENTKTPPPPVGLPMWAVPMPPGVELFPERRPFIDNPLLYRQVLPGQAFPEFDRPFLHQQREVFPWPDEHPRPAPPVRLQRPPHMDARVPAFPPHFAATAGTRAQPWPLADADIERLRGAMDEARAPLPPRRRHRAFGNMGERD